MHACTYVHTYTHKYTHTHIAMYVCTCVYVCMYVYIYIYICIRKYVAGEDPGKVLVHPLKQVRESKTDKLKCNM